MRNLPWISIIIIVAMLFAAIFAPVLTSHSPIDQSLPDKLLPPAADFEPRPNDR